MNKLALFGGKPIREKSLPAWPFATEREKRYLSKVINSNGWGIFRGNMVNQFGQAFAEYHGARYGIPCVNATVALELQLRALGIGRGDEVITTVYTFIATATAIVNVGAIPIFVDIQEDDYCIDPGLIEVKITSRTKALMPVHLYGSLCNLDDLVRIAKKHKLYLIEDAAQVPGSFWRGKGVGTFGDSGSFSFQESKVMTAGEGGIVITNNQDISELINAYLNCGRIPKDTKISRKVLGGNFRMTEFQAAILLGQLELLKERTEIRQRNADYLTSRLREIPCIRVIKKHPNVTRQAYYSYVFKYLPEVAGVPRMTFIKAFEAEGIPTRPIYVPIYKDPLFYLNPYDAPEAWQYYKEKPFLEKEFPVAERAGFTEAVVIWHPFLLGEKSDLDDIINAIAKVFENISELRNLAQ